MTQAQGKAEQQMLSQLPVDPTKNVLDLVAAEARYRDSMRVADNRFNDAMREKDLEFSRMMLAAAVKRTDDLYGALGARISAVEQWHYESSGKGIGRTDVIAYVITFISVSIAAAVLFVKMSGP